MTDSRTAWLEPGVEYVADGVFRIPLPLPQDGLKAVNVYAVVDADGLVLIDGGWALAESEQQLERSLAELDAELGDVRRFLVTHVHRDHYTQAVELRRRFGARIALGRGEQPSLDLIVRSEDQRLPTQVQRLRDSGAADLAALLVRHWEAKPADMSSWEFPDEWLDSPVDVRLGNRTLQVLATPGHTAGHVVFLDAEAGLLFAGDHVLPHITPSIGFVPLPGPHPLADFLSSLQLVRELPDTRLLPAHGPLAPSVHARVDELLDHHARRLDATEQAVVDGADTAAAIADRLPWTRRERKLADLDPFNQMLAVIETAAHADLLVARGRLRQETIDGVVHVATAGH